MAKTKRIIGLTVAIFTILAVCLLSACGKNDDGNKTTSYSLSISATAMTLEVGETDKLECRCGDKKIIFTSSDEAIATVAEDGTITAVSAGVAYVTAKAEGTDEQKTCKVTVTKSVYSVSLDKQSEVNALKGTTLDFTATVYKNGEASTIAPEFSVSPSGCAVSAKGNVVRVTFSEVGVYTVKAAYNGATATVTVTVMESVVA